MAQALFDEHPLEQYLRSKAFKDPLYRAYPDVTALTDAGEARDLIPGSTVELELELDPLWGMDLAEDDRDLEEWRPLFLINIIEVFTAAISAMDVSSHPSPFVERFKYDVISSSLLALSLPSSHTRTPRSALPGQLEHSRTSSVETQQDTLTDLPVAAPESSYIIPSLALLMAAVLSHARYFLLALISFAITVYTFKAANDVPRHDMSPSLESLNDLIASSNEWESVVQEAISILENDERSSSTSYGSSTPTSSSSIRVALHSSLLTTQTQCDNVRQLFSALTSPSELSQLSEMYAPASPMVPSFQEGSSTRPLSLPATRRRTISIPPSDPFHVQNKRQTWNGEYSKLVQLGSPTTAASLAFKRREKRRSDLSAVRNIPSNSRLSKTASAPVTPMPMAPLQHVSEEEAEESEYEDAQAETPPSESPPYTAESPFGAAALALHRKRKSAGMEAFRLPPPSYFSPTSSSPPPPGISPRTPKTPQTATMASGSRFTPIQAARHPLSLSAINLALQSALAAKRYACSHLLALRFADEDDEGYWEDVRSIMGLLTSTLVDAASRLAGALTEVEQQKLRDQNPTPCASSFEDSDKSMDSSRSMDGMLSPPRPRRRPENISFAPLPSSVSRFAAHAEAVISALDDARDNLEECVAALRVETHSGTRGTSSDRRRRRPLSRALNLDHDSAPEEGSPALEAYERLRRELGVALRECERGRERLLEVVYPPELRAADDDEEDSGEDVPALGHDGSDDSDKPDRAFPFDDEGEAGQEQQYAVVAVEGADDATAHLLLATSSDHLPPPGIEQVFEAESGNIGVFTRERSRLTREERIQLVKARRESGMGGLGFVDLEVSQPIPATKKGVEKWGPGGEVVQELKDVIWKVGERRRRMADATAKLDTALDSVSPSEVVSP